MVSKTSRVVAFAGWLVMAVCGVAFAEERWQRLGSAAVNDRLDHDAIVVSGARGDFSAIKLRVERAAVHFVSVKVHFANGETQDVELRAVVPAGGESRVIDIAGADRLIRRVEFWYETQTARHGNAPRCVSWGAAEPHPRRRG